MIVAAWACIATMGGMLGAGSDCLDMRWPVGGVAEGPPEREGPGNPRLQLMAGDMQRTAGGTITEVMQRVRDW